MTDLSPAEVKSAFRYRSRVQEMFADPDLTGEVLLLAIAMFNECQMKAEKSRANITWRETRRALGWDLNHLRIVVSSDFPRYEVDHSAPVRCGAPMIRREGLCDKPTTWALTFEDRDPDTGEGKMLGFCSRHGEMQFDVRARIKQWVANGKPQPPDNTGGLLRRYFVGNWDEIYQWARPYGKLTDGTGKPPTPPRPVLTLIHGGAA